MSVADRVGLLSWFDWAVFDSYAWGLTLALFLLSVVPILIVWRDEGRMHQIGTNQYDTAYPGSVFLAISISGLAWIARDIPARDFKFQESGFQWLLLIGIVLLALLLTIARVSRGIYSWKRSPSFDYHLKDGWDGSTERYWADHDMRRGLIKSPLAVYNKIIVFVVAGYLWAAFGIAVIFGDIYWDGGNVFQALITGLSAGGWAWMVIRDLRGGLYWLRRKAYYSYRRDGRYPIRDAKPVQWWDDGVPDRS